VIRRSSPAPGNTPPDAARAPARSESARRTVNPRVGRGASTASFAATLARASVTTGPTPRRSGPGDLFLASSARRSFEAGLLSAGRSAALPARLARASYTPFSQTAGRPFNSRADATGRSLSPHGERVGERGGNIPYASLIHETARRAGIEPALLAAVAHAESNFNPQARSAAGAKGLMQLMDGTARGLGVADSFDPAQNLAGGARYLASLLKQFRGDHSLALAAYNAGPGTVQQFGGIPPYEETRRYVPKVLGLLDHYRRRWAAAPVEEIA
jgi:soluble lytic murein transglycosylase-like protein